VENSKIRARVLKGDEVRFISHLDFLNTMNRALRRANIPIAYSQGYNPTPNISFATALAVGLTSDSEYIDFEMEEEMEVQDFKEGLNKALPKGIEVLEAEQLVAKSKSLASLVSQSSYFARLELTEEIKIDKLREEVANFLSQQEIVIRRKRRRKKDRVFDIKPMISKLEVIGVQENLATISMLVQTGSSGNLRPEEVIDALADYSEFIQPAKLVNIHRSGLYIEREGEILTPIEAVKR
jgi:radical SAM-linked protein